MSAATGHPRYATPLAIGPLRLATNLVLAPLSGYTDLSFRLVARSCGGVGLAYTDLLCPQGVVRQNRRTRELTATCPQDSPLAMQLYGANAEELAEAARWAENHGAATVDLNMGCPAEKITRREGGSKLLCDPDKAVRLVERLVAAVARTPITVKMRLGWERDELMAPRLAVRLEQAGVAAIAVHGRTTAMKFSGSASLEGIAAVVAAVPRIPVLGNGDVRTPQDALRMLQATGCHGVMIGRAALSTPWIFRDTWSFLTAGTIPPPPTLRQKCALMRMHFENLASHRGPRTAVLEFRHLASWYAKTMHPCRPMRDAMRALRTAGDFHRAIDEFLAWRGADLPDLPGRALPSGVPAV